MLNCCSKTAAIHSPTGALLLHLRRCKSLSSAMGVLKTFFFFLLEYGKKLLIHIETILLSVKQFLSYVIVKDQKHCQSGGEKKPKRKKKFSFRSTISPTFTSINSISMKWVLPLKSNFSLVRQCIDLDLDSLSAFLPKFFIFFQTDLLSFKMTAEPLSLWKWKSSLLQKRQLLLPSPSKKANPERLIEKESKANY